MSLSPSREMRLDQRENKKEVQLARNQKGFEKRNENSFFETSTILTKLSRLTENH